MTVVAAPSFSFRAEIVELADFVSFVLDPNIMIVDFSILVLAVRQN
jgi:hypothetical protein